MAWKFDTNFIVTRAQLFYDKVFFSLIFASFKSQRMLYSYLCFIPQFLMNASRKELSIGPGSGSYGESEVLNLPSFTPANCTPPVFPHDSYHGYVGRLSPDGSLLCGGAIRNKVGVKTNLNIFQKNHRILLFQQQQK